MRRPTRVILAGLVGLVVAGCGGGGEAERAARTESEGGGVGVEASGITSEPGIGLQRTPVVLPVEAASAVRGGMLRMLSSLQEATAAAAAGDTAGAAEAARASGMAGAGMIPPAARDAAPQEFLGLGMRTHQAFDVLARHASAGAPADTLLADVASIVSVCNDCHEQYTLEVESTGR